jgi:hypothetical protein
MIITVGTAREGRAKGVGMGMGMIMGIGTNLEVEGIDAQGMGMGRVHFFVGLEVCTSLGGHCRQGIRVSGKHRM